MEIKSLLNKLIQKKNLTGEETESFLNGVLKNEITPAQTAAFIMGLRIKGETVEEIEGLIKAVRKNMTTVQNLDGIDVCGTGGDGSLSFNVSTAVAFVVAGAGIKVAKHGNRSASSICGSADVLEELGININLSPIQAEKILKKVGMVFLFAPLFHSALKNVGMIRKELGVRTIFNFLGPFANPALVKRQLVGVPDIQIADKLAQVARKLNYKKLILATSEDGLDEISIGSKTFIYEIRGKSIKKSITNPLSYGFKKINKKELEGGNSKINANIIGEILSGIKSPKRDIVVFNSAFALYVADKVKNIKEGIIKAEKSIDSGKAKLVLEKLIKETQKYE